MRQIGMPHMLVKLFRGRVTKLQKDINLIKGVNKNIYQEIKNKYTGCTQLLYKFYAA